MLHPLFRSGQEIDFEACVPVAEGVSGGGQIKARELSGGPMASVMHMGPYYKVGGAYEALREWMTRNGYNPAGPCREVYVVGPGQTMNPADYKT